ncbi:Protein of uncharacterised function (DUF3423) [Klebsiella pneumoniae]|nr:Protein of uncharacterised function (DUF3423) [Klebsiella pneumoniae]
MRRHHVIFFLHTDNLMGNFRHGAQREFLTRKNAEYKPLVGLFCMVLAIYATKCQGHPALDCIRCIYESLRYISMGIVKISDLLHDDIRDASKAMSRSVNAQAEYWIRLGMMSELYPELNHQQIKLLMLKSGSDRLLEVINAINNH